MTDNQLSSIPPMAGMTASAPIPQNAPAGQTQVMQQENNAFMDIPSQGVPSSPQQPIYGMAPQQSQTAQGQENTVQQFNEIPQQPSMNMENIPQQAMTMPQSFSFGQASVSETPPTSTASTNETPNFSTIPNLNIVPESPSLSGGSMNNTQQTFFTPSQTPQTEQEPLREYIEEKKGTTPVAVFVIALFSLVLGVFFGVTFFATEEPPKIEGLQGVVRNPDLEGERLQRCGQAEKGRACVLYIFNHTHYDRTVDSFFDEVVRLTEISKYSIAMVNAQYAKTLIRPGAIAEIKVPAQN